MLVECMLGCPREEFGSDQTPWSMVCPIEELSVLASLVGITCEVSTDIHFMIIKYPYQIQYNK